MKNELHRLPRTALMVITSDDNNTTLELGWQFTSASPLKAEQRGFHDKLWKSVQVTIIAVWKIHLSKVNVTQILWILYNIFSVPILTVLRTLHQIQTKCAPLHFSLCLLQCCKKNIESLQHLYYWSPILMWTNQGHWIITIEQNTVSHNVKAKFRDYWTLWLNTLPATNWRSTVRSPK